MDNDFKVKVILLLNLLHVFAILRVEISAVKSMMLGLVLILSPTFLISTFRCLPQIRHVER